MLKVTGRCKTVLVSCRVTILIIISTLKAFVPYLQIGDLEPFKSWHHVDQADMQIGGGVYFRTSRLSSSASMSAHSESCMIYLTRLLLLLLAYYLLNQTSCRMWTSGSSPYIWPTAFSFSLTAVCWPRNPLRSILDTEIFIRGKGAISPRNPSSL